MTTIRTTRQVLLVSGILSSLVYIATDVLGGLRYPGYSFTSQAISELMATGAPSEAFVDPLFLTYGVLALAFGVGVLREAAGLSGALRGTGAASVGCSARYIDTDRRREDAQSGGERLYGKRT